MLNGIWKNLVNMKRKKNIGMTTTKKINLKLVGLDGNAFVLLGKTLS